MKCDSGWDQVRNCSYPAAGFFVLGKGSYVGTAYCWEHALMVLPGLKLHETFNWYWIDPAMAQVYEDEVVLATLAGFGKKKGR